MGTFAYPSPGDGLRRKKRYGPTRLCESALAVGPSFPLLRWGSRIVRSRKRKRQQRTKRARRRMRRSAVTLGLGGIQLRVVRIRGQEKESKERNEKKRRRKDVRVCVFSLCHSLCAKSRSNERGGENFSAKRPFLPTTAAEAARTILGVRPLQGPPRNAPKAIVTRGVVLVIDGAAPVENALARRSLSRRGSSCQPQPVNLASDGAFSPLPFLSARVFSWRPKKCAPYDRRHVGPFAVSLSWQQPTDSSLTLTSRSPGLVRKGPMYRFARTSLNRRPSSLALKPRVSSSGWRIRRK